jgi:hypothetical protein
MSKRKQYDHKPAAKPVQVPAGKDEKSGPPAPSAVVRKPVAEPPPLIEVEGPRVEDYEIDPRDDLILKLRDQVEVAKKGRKAAESVRETLERRVKALEKLSQSLREQLLSREPELEKVVLEPGTEYLHISAHRERGFWRCDRFWSRKPIDVPVSEFKPEEIERLLADKNLSVRRLVVPVLDEQDVGE